jgi:predicted ribosome quality control (RQC) complex YloA/Tae2 family protein
MFAEADILGTDSMMSLKELQRSSALLEELLRGSRLQRVVQEDAFRLALEFHGQAGTQTVLLSCRPRFAHISILHETPKAQPVPPSFVQFLRAHFGRATLACIICSQQDRRVALCLETREGTFEIVLSFLGARTNIYLLDREGVLLHAMRPLQETRRELALGSLFKEPEGKPKSEGEDRWQLVPDDRYPQAVEDTYARLEHEEATAILGRRIANALNKEADYLERKAVNLLQDLGEAVQADEHRRKGELLKLALHSIRPGDDSVTVTDHENGTPVEISLDPRLSAAENLLAYFKRYQKELRRTSVLQEQLRALRKTQDSLAELQRRLSAALNATAPDFAKLQALAAEPRVRKLLLRYYPERTPHGSRQAPLCLGKKPIPIRLRPKRYKTEQGLEIWVGRNDEGNDYLTTKLAHGNDLFFHLEGYPGSHVILRAAGKSTPLAESVLDACELAAHFSKMKDARHVDVHVSPVKNVRKPKGAKPGLVYVARGKTIHLRRDPKRLENILASRQEE